MRRTIETTVHSFYDRFAPNFLIQGLPVKAGEAAWYLDALWRQERPVQIRYRLKGGREGKLGLDVSPQVKGSELAPFVTINSRTLPGYHHVRQQVGEWHSQLLNELGYEQKK